MIKSKKTKAPVLFDLLNNNTSVIYLNLEEFYIGKNHFDYKFSFSYKEDERDVFILNESMNLAKESLNGKENSFRKFKGMNMSDKLDDMYEYLMNEYIDSKNCFGTSSDDWEDVLI